MEKLNNLLSFSEFEKTWKAEDQKKTKRTELGLDIIKEENTGNYPVPASLRGKTHLPDNDSWTNRFEIKSESSNRVYIVSQNKSSGEWGCSCPGWRIMRNGVRKCKHLSSLGLLGAGDRNKELGG
jgi:hypothetical protein